MGRAWLPSIGAGNRGNRESPWQSRLRMASGVMTEKSATCAKIKESAWPIALEGNNGRLIFGGNRRGEVRHEVKQQAHEP